MLRDPMAASRPSSARSPSPRTSFARRGLGADRGRATRASSAPPRRGERAAVPARHRPRLGDGGVRHAAGLEHAAASRASRRAASVGGRTHEIQRLIGRSLRAVTDLRGARRAHDLDRLRRHRGRRRHAHGVDHRRLRRPGPGRAPPARARRAHRQSAAPTRSPRSASASSAARCWSTSATPRTAPPTST